MHLKGNWLDESSFIDFLLSKIKISPTDKAPFCAKPLKLHSKSFAKHTKFKLLYTISFVAGDQVHTSRGEVSLQSIQTGMPQWHYR